MTRPLPPARAVTRPALLVLVRHGESARNVAKKHNRFFLDDESRKAVQGIPDWQIPLTDVGHRQAADTGRVLRDRFGAGAAPTLFAVEKAAEDAGFEEWRRFSGLVGFADAAKGRHHGHAG